MKRNSLSGFTLVELLIVVGIMFFMMYGCIAACSHFVTNDSHSVESSVSSDKYVDRDKVVTNFVMKTIVDIEKIKEDEMKKIKQTRPVHHVTFEFTQSSFTLNIAQHIRNAANAFDFTVPVTEEFYNSVRKGQELQSKFKTASFILGGHIGSRKVYVKDKFIKYVEER